MGGGALIQLIAYGIQNVFLTGSPQITYFKSIYRRYTNFAIESVQQDTIGNLSPGSKVSVTIQRNGDLLKNIVMQYNPSKIVPINNLGVNCIASNLGHTIIKEYELEIGGQLIDRQYGLWLTIWRDLNDIYTTDVTYPITDEYGSVPPYSKTYNSMAYTYNSFGFTGIYGPNGSDLLNNDDSDNLTFPPIISLNTSKASTEAYVPMRFWFCRNPGLAIPLIALQYHEVKFNFTLADKENIISFYNNESRYNEINIDFRSIKIFTEYIFLDSTERAKFADNQHEYLIEQLQYSTHVNNILRRYVPTLTIPLTLKHPVKEIIICGKPDNKPQTYYFNKVIGKTHGIATYNALLLERVIGYTKAKLSLVFNQLPRFSPRNLKYFARQQVWEYHKGSSVSNDFPEGLALYSFALQPDEYQPSGTCNFSRIENPRLEFTDIEWRGFESINDLCIFATNYNILRIGSGMGSVVFSS